MQFAYYCLLKSNNIIQKFFVYVFNLPLLSMGLPTIQGQSGNSPLHMLLENQLSRNLVEKWWHGIYTRFTKFFKWVRYYWATAILINIKNLIFYDNKNLSKNILMRYVWEFESAISRCESYISIYGREYKSKNFQSFFCLNV